VVGAASRAPSPSRRRSRSSKKKYPKIKIKPEFTDYEAFWERFRTQASGGNPPDVFQNAVGFLRK
jgi:multiple sugar transport system substrate-binding protein